jgi:SAM-dependent methyltransferase
LLADVGNGLSQDEKHKQNKNTVTVIGNATARKSLVRRAGDGAANVKTPAGALSSQISSTGDVGVPIPGGPQQHDGSLADSTQKSPLLDQDRALSTLDEIYQHHSTDPWSSDVDHAGTKMEVAKANGETGVNAGVSAIYGEILPKGVAEFLKKYAKKGQKYYDLGAGNGKTVALAYLLGLDATGVEIGTQRWKNACAAVERLKSNKSTTDVEHGPGMRQVHGSFLEVDFSDADIVFIDNLEFPPEVTAGIAKTARKLKPGAKILSAKALQGPEFKMLGQVSSPASWSEGQTWLLQEVTKSSTTSIPGEEALKEHKYGSQATQGPTVCAL